MGELETQIQQPFSLPPPPPPPRPLPPLSSASDPPLPPPPPFDPGRMIGIIRRKALIKDLAAAYHADCLTYCQQLLELQKKTDEPFTDIKAPEESRKEMVRPSKRLKKSR